jgi:hypothetical protein
MDCLKSKQSHQTIGGPAAIHVLDDMDAVKSARHQYF